MLLSMRFPSYPKSATEPRERSEVERLRLKMLTSAARAKIKQLEERELQRQGLNLANELARRPS